jgi:RNA polymerase sigma factor (TIGR02999 family)
MGTEFQDEVTRLLKDIKAGDEQAKNKLFDLVYANLHSRAEKLMREEREWRPDHTWRTTDLLNGAVLNLLESDFFKKTETEKLNGKYFFGAMANAMHRILVDHARGKIAKSRDPGGKRVPLDDIVDDFQTVQHVNILELDEALEKLAEVSAQERGQRRPLASPRGGQEARGR